MVDAYYKTKGLPFMHRQNGAFSEVIKGVKHLGASLTQSVHQNWASRISRASETDPLSGFSVGN
jgi:hypothetical protein